MPALAYGRREYIGNCSDFERVLSGRRTCCAVRKRVNALSDVHEEISTKSLFEEALTILCIKREPGVGVSTDLRITRLPRSGFKL
jgi:hypothetical protein